MTDIARHIPVLESNTENAYMGEFIFQKNYFVQDFQKGLDSIKIMDLDVKQFIQEFFSVEELNMIIEQTPDKLRLQIQLNNLKQDVFTNCSEKEPSKLQDAWLTSIREPYITDNIRIDLPRIYECISIALLKQDLFEIVDMLVCVGNIITHPTKGQCYLIFWKEDTQICLDCIPSTYFFSTTHHYWFVTKMKQLPVEKNKH